MQRLSSWFEQLPLRRRGSSRRSKNCDSLSYSHKRQSKSAVPQLHYSVSAVQSYSYKYRDPSAGAPSQSLMTNDQQLHVIQPHSWNRQETTVNQPCRNSSKFATSFLQSFSSPTSSERKNIRTNPWISHNRPLIQATDYQGLKPADELMYASIDRTTSFRIKNLDESTYSSGYGSQDSSPESSVHTPDWQPAITTGKCSQLEDKEVECNSTDVDEALGLDLENKSEMEDLKPMDAENHFGRDDEHIYHELEAFGRFSFLLDSRSCSSDSEIACSSDGSLHSPRCPSPIYTQPNPNHRSLHRCQYRCERCEEDWVSEYPNVASGFIYIPCASYKPPPEFHPPPPPLQPPPAPLLPFSPRTRTNDLEQAEMDFLIELDAQIAELQLKSVEVRQLVDQARERRHARARNAQLCHELAEMRRTKWVLHNHFELAL
ncbi:unnamed protein product [Litomosoides sigmodontis]|uniref:Uncharacterized protein n=1 Tax=Litomosoides sigmodontis TaxID=42156 RepID=A0A3P6UD24_LITSI|nr:unnamed protein product [Litomosoides sigmodontis]